MYFHHIILDRVHILPVHTKFLIAYIISLSYIQDLHDRDFFIHVYRSWLPCCYRVLALHRIIRLILVPRTASNYRGLRCFWWFFLSLLIVYSSSLYEGVMYDFQMGLNFISKWYHHILNINLITSAGNHVISIARFLDSIPDLSKKCSSPLSYNHLVMTHTQNLVLHVYIQFLYISTCQNQVWVSRKKPK